MKRWLLLLIPFALGLCVTEPAFAQSGSLYSNTAYRYTPAGIFPASGASVQICTSTATGQPCTPTVTVFSDAALSLPVANPLAACTVSPQVGCIDGFGNFSFYAAQGAYTYTVTGSGITSYGPTAFGLSCVAGVNCVAAAANNAFSGNNTHSGLETFTNLINSATIATIDGVNPNLVALDLRGTTVPSNTALNKTIAYNINTVGNTNSMVREQMTVNSIGAAGSVLTHYFITSLNNATGGNVVDGVSTEAQTTGTFSGVLGSISGNESVSSLLSTGGTVSVASGGQGYVFNQAGNTTLVTDARGLDGVGCRTTGTAPLHCSGLYARFQSLGSVSNYSLRFESVGLMKYQNGIAGLDAEDPALIAHRFVFIASDNSANVQAVNAIGLNLNSSDSAVRAVITSSGLQTNTALFPRLAGNHPVGTAPLPYSGFFYGAAATNNAQLTGTFTAARTHTGPDASGTLLISGNGDGTHAIKNQSVRFSGVLGGTCPTAAAIGAACTSGNINWTTSFGDNSYAVVCTLNGTLTGQPHIVGTTYQAGGVGITITIAADTAVAANVAAAGFTHCIAIHD